MKNDSNGKPLLVTKFRTKGDPDLKSLDSMKLTTTSHPIECFDSMTMTREIGASGKRLSLHDEWTRHTNIKAILMGSGEGAHFIYPEFASFAT